MAGIAQLAEQGFCKPQVRGSNPCVGTIFFSVDNTSLLHRQYMPRPDRERHGVEQTKRPYGRRGRRMYSPYAAKNAFGRSLAGLSCCVTVALNWAFTVIFPVS
jgi:hypothetical protein